MGSDCGEGEGEDDDDEDEDDEAARILRRLPRAREWLDIAEDEHSSATGAVSKPQGVSE